MRGGGGNRFKSSLLNGAENSQTLVNSLFSITSFIENRKRINENRSLGHMVNLSEIGLKSFLHH
jgi:hypothetical protein